MYKKKESEEDSAKMVCEKMCLRILGAYNFCFYVQSLKIQGVISICFFSLETSGPIKLTTQSQRVNPSLSAYTFKAIFQFDRTCIISILYYECGYDSKLA